LNGCKEILEAAVKKLVVPALIFLLLAGLAACQLAPTPVPLPPSPMPTATLTPLPPTPTAAPTQTPILPLNSPNGPPLKSIHMFTPQDGWGLVDDALLLTHDGGLSWYSVPLPDGQVSKSTEAVFLNMNLVFLLLPAPDGQSGQLYSTTDGGGTWLVNPVPFGRGELVFIDGATFFLQTDRIAPDAMRVVIYSTADSPTWARMFPGEGQDAGSSISEAGIKTGFSFINVDRGWLGVASQPQKIVLYQTDTTGRTWTHQELPAPENITSLITTTLPPLFFAGNDAEGILPVEFVSMDTGDKNLVFYDTTDSGATWNPGSSVTDGGAYTFLNPQTGWVWGKRGLYFTNDGAQTWTLLPVAFGRSENATWINFIDQKNGWLVTVGLGSRVRLYHTNDGGNTWTTTIP
jgi:photosystem II stability/assembly factor-like uncharacterized protein